MWASKIAYIGALALEAAAFGCSVTESNEETAESTSALLQDSWTVHFDCTGANNNGFKPPTLQVHYHEWQTIPLVTSVLRGINGYAFFVYNPNWRVHSVTIRVFDEVHPQGVLDHGFWTYGGTQSASNAPFGPFEGVTRGEQLVEMTLTNGTGDTCTGVLRDL